MIKYSLGALVAAGLLAGGFATSANAADLGGNCCADLEERIAELEATTARKGNRKVSLTVSGWVGQQMMFWDDGYQSNVYIHDLGTTLNSHVKFTGQATIAPGWSAGYVLQLETNSSDGLLGINQAQPDGPRLAGLQGNIAAGSVNVLQSYWFIKSDHYGKVGLGLQSQASDNTGILVDGSGSLVPANYVGFDYGGFALRGSGGAPGNIWFAANGCTDCNGVPTNNIRYDSPTFGGFSMSTSWGENDFWDIAARYAGEHGGFKLAAAFAYSRTTENSNTLGTGTLPVVYPYLAQAQGTDFYQVGAYAQHVATGLFLYSAYTDIKSYDSDGVDNWSWYIKPGLRTKCLPFGATVYYGEYQKFDNKYAGYIVGDDTGTDHFKSDLWGLGVVQEIDAAAMSVWVKYRQLSGHYSDHDDADPKHFNYVGVGGLINF